ncbi:MAG: Hint domain-containing protein [Rhodobacteraceae bacterium]|nr:Hint domain-containing protein [Paracoccaceae bacterium]
MTTTYSADALVYNGSGPGSWQLRADYNHAVHRVNIAFSDDDADIDGDATNDEVGSDANQTAIVTDMLGNPVASGRIYDEMYYGVSTGGGPNIYIEVLEIGGVVVGYAVDAPLTPGLTYDIDDSGDVSSGSTVTYASLAEIACFGPGTLISTTEGDLPVEWLAEGDRVITRDHGAQSLRWIGRYRLSAAQMAANPALRPVLIEMNALGPGAPEYPLVVSPQHRIFVDGPEVEYYFGDRAVLAAAKHLTDRRAGYCPENDFVFYHLLFDDHHVIRANWMWAESLLATDRPRQISRAAGVVHPAHIRHDRAAYRCLVGWEARFLRQARGGMGDVRRRAA